MSWNEIYKFETVVKPPRDQWVSKGGPRLYFVFLSPSTILCIIINESDYGNFVAVIYIILCNGHRLSAPIFRRIHYAPVHSSMVVTARRLIIGNFPLSLHTKFNMKWEIYMNDPSLIFKNEWKCRRHETELTLKGLIFFMQKCHNSPGAHFMSHFSIVIQIRRKIHSALIQVVGSDR